MNNGSWIRALAIAALVMVMATALGVGAYNAGAAHAVAEGGGHVHWGHGFGFPVFPLFFLFFAFFVMRGLLWGGRWGAGPGWGYGHRYYDGVPPAFEEWHRRAHARDDQPPPPKP